jgi:hypothetical protein
MYDLSIKNNDHTNKTVTQVTLIQLYARLYNDCILHYQNIKAKKIIIEKTLSVII